MAIQTWKVWPVTDLSSEIDIRVEMFKQSSLYVPDSAGSHLLFLINNLAWIVHLILCHCVPMKDPDGTKADRCKIP